MSVYVCTEHTNTQALAQCVSVCVCEAVVSEPDCGYF